MCLGCHVVDVAVKFTDLNALDAACKKLGWKLVRHQTTYKWNEHWVDDSPVPRNIFDTEAEYNRVVAMTREQRVAYMNNRLGKCDHAIQVPGAEYEIGLLQKPGGFIPVWDWVSYGGLGKAMCSASGKQDGGPLAQAYAQEKVKQEASRRGFACNEVRQADGTVRLTIRQWG